ncbi:nucleotide-binding protein [Christiangramia sp. SM2212]|uniref:Nucleotide-binding protein n=1 Tax=Christiangramia sediminicola TaxID=3073267 RepID=A0ABU1ERW3_9FLAO|nr:nucleotide-binding protein [Christiangramia sp. SM2212]MDR5591135.1 nucleotide-binding protein [Christiangramia sp. SM2212]
MTEFDLKKKKVIEDLEEYKNLIRQWTYNDLDPTETNKLRSKINRKKSFVEDVVSRTGSAKRFDWSPPPMVGGLGMQNVNPFDVFFDPPYQTNVASIIIDSIDQAIGVLETVIKDENGEEIFDQPKKTKTRKKDRKEIFIVHGHDNELKEKVARFLEKLKLKPIILHEQVNGGLTVIEKFEKFSEVQFAIILMTPDDIGNSVKNQKRLNLRARQNVIFELGYFLGKLGRENVCALLKDNIEKPSDYDGVVYIAVDPSDGWKLLLTKELKRAQMDFDANEVFE